MRNRRPLFRLPFRAGRDLDADVDAELRFHLDMRAAELTARGLTPEAARTEALRQFGDLEDARRYMRAADADRETATRRREQMIDLRQDLTLAARTLRRSPGFAAVVVLALAFGIGATTAIFTLVDALLLRPLPVAHPERLVGFGDPALVGVTNTGAPRTDNFSYELYLAFRDRARLLSGLTATGYSSRLDVVVPAAGASAGAVAEPERVRGRLVSGNYFAVLGVRAAAGRTFGADDDRAPGASPVAVISDAYWRRRFGRDPAVVGRSILVNRVPVTVVGVAAPGFGGEVVGRQSDVWLPLTMQPLLLPNQDWLRDRRVSWLMMMGRLRPGVTPAQAGAELTALARQALAEGGGPPRDSRTVHVDAFDGRRGILGIPAATRAGLATLLALTLLVLGVVSANVANLLLARTAARRAEIGVRLAMGAGRLRVVRQLLAESVLLGAAAGAIALLVVAAGRALLFRWLAASGEPIPADLRLDARVLGFAAALSLGTALLLGLVPAARGTRLDLAAALRSRGRGTSGGAQDGTPGGARWRLGFGQWLVVAQVALSIVLLAGAGLLLRTARHLEDVDVGVARDRLLVVAVDAQAAGYSGERLAALHRQLAERLRSLPGVERVAYSQNGLFSGIDAGATLQVAGFVPRAADDTSASTDQVSAGYFATIGARIVRGRDVEARDDARGARVAVINETMARFYFGARDPVGQAFTIDGTPHTIVGVAADVRDHSLSARPARRFYTAMAQGGAPGLVVFTVRTAGDPARLTDAARRAVLAENPSLRLRNASPLAELMRESIGPQRLLASLAGVAGGLALLLTALGLHGVMTYAIVRRTGEFGLRMALGARPRDVTRLVLRETLTLVALGAAAGVPAALGAARLLRHQLVGVGLVDPPTLIATLAGLSAVAAVAGYRPARRAARSSPQEALREG
jgi:predicted permease